MNTSERPQPGTPAGDTTVFYSTPFGDTKDGQKKLFMLGRDGIPFYPVFYSRESTIEFFERMNRAGYMIIEGTIASVQHDRAAQECRDRHRTVQRASGGDPARCLTDAGCAFERLQQSIHQSNGRI